MQQRVEVLQGMDFGLNAEVMARNMNKKIDKMGKDGWALAQVTSLNMPGGWFSSHRCVAIMVFERA